jgi:putative ABC transport system substrate-binding protein
MRRREFIAGLGSAAAWPLAARAQQAGNVVRIGFLGAASASGYANQLAGFRQGLRDLNYVEGANIIIEYRWAEGNYARLPQLAAELVRSNVAVIVTHGTPGSLAAKQATTTIPIVMANTGDPVAAGIVASFARPGGNITGQSFFNPELSAKKIGLLKEILPQITRVAYLINPDNPGSIGASLPAIEIAAQYLKLELQQFSARGPNEFESAFERMERGRIEAVEVDEDAMFNANIGAVAVLAAKRRLLSIGNKEFAQAGGLIGYGVDSFATFRRAAAFVDKILKGTNPADLPIEQATKFQFVLNLKTAKALGLTVPQSILLRADEVIE